MTPMILLPFPFDSVSSPIRLIIAGSGGNSFHYVLDFYGEGLLNMIKQALVFDSANAGKGDKKFSGDRYDSGAIMPTVPDVMSGCGSGWVLMDKFEETAIPYIGTLYKMAYHLAGNKEDAEDPVQEVYLKARKSFHTLRDHAKCKSWLCSILYRRFIDERRRSRHFVELGDVPDPNSKYYRDWPDRFTSEDISKALAKLDPKQKTLLVAHFISGLRYQEIADSMEIPIGTVMSRIYRAKNAMRKELTRVSKQPSLKIVRGGKHGM